MLMFDQLYATREKTMEPKFELLEGFCATGKGIRTTNENGASARDQGALWANLMQTGVLSPILAATGEETVWGIYSRFEKDHTRPFDFALAARTPIGYPTIESGETIEIPGGDYAVFRLTGASPEEASVRVWETIWAWSAANPLRRAYGIDLERWSLGELMRGGPVSVMVYISVRPR